MSILKEWGGDADLADRADKFVRRATKHRVELGKAITAIGNSRKSSQIKKAERLLKKFNSYHRKIWKENLSDCLAATNRHTILVTALFYEVEKYITDDELFWGIWHFYHDKFENFYVGNVYSKQLAMFTRGDRATRDAMFIETAHQKVCNAATKLDLNGTDFESYYSGFKAAGNLRIYGSLAFDRNMGWLAQHEDEGEIEIWRGFWVDEYQHWTVGDEHKTAQIWIREGNRGQKQDGNLTAETQNDGKGFSYSLDRNVAIYFAHKQVADRDERGKKTGRRAVVARYKIKAKNIRACFFEEGESEIFAFNDDARLIDYRLDKSKTFSKRNTDRAMAAVNKQREKATATQLATGALSIIGAAKLARGEMKKAINELLKQQKQDQGFIKERADKMRVGGKILRKARIKASGRGALKNRSTAK